MTLTQPNFTPSKKPVLEMCPAELTDELQMYKERFGYVRPDRSTIDPSRNWMNGTPNYDAADVLYFRGKSKNHEQGSLESTVENAVKTWESEASHLPFADWTSVDHATYRVLANGGKVYVGEDAAKAGNYNWLMASANKSLYDAEVETFHSSHSMFRGAFGGGFPWEVLAVFAGPPKITFSWRHWGDFTGMYKGREGDGKRYEMYGFGTLTVTEDLKLKQIEIWYKPDEWLQALEDGTPELTRNGKSLIGNECPFSSSRYGTD